MSRVSFIVTVGFPDRNRMRYEDYPSAFRKNSEISAHTIHPGSRTLALRPLVGSVNVVMLDNVDVHNSTAMQRMAHDTGECATAKASAKAGTLMTLSSWSTTALEDVAKAGGPGGKRWFQLYVYKVFVGSPLLWN